MQSTRTCSFPGCDKPRSARGVCGGHYQQLAKGNELRPLRASSLGLTLEQRFWSRVTKNSSSGCWEWTSYTNSDGYGLISVNRRNALAHRVSWELANGPIPDGMVLDHRCANPKCVNPYHLRTVTQAQNLQHLTGPRSNNTSGVRGVSWNKRQNAWHAYANLNGRRYHGGFHLTLEAASQAARTLRAQLHTHDDHEEWVSKHKGNKTVAAIDLVAVRSADGVLLGYEKL